jgi:hypothetical protein
MQNLLLILVELFVFLSLFMTACGSAISWCASAQPNPYLGMSQWCSKSAMVTYSSVFSRETTIRLCVDVKMPLD